METNYNFQDIWNNKKTEVPNVQEIKSKAEKYRKKQIINDIRLIACLSLTFIFITGIWIFLDVQLFSTRFGIMLILLSLAIYVYLFWQKMNILRQINPSTNNQDYLKAVKLLEKKQLFMQNRGLGLYFLLLSVGFAFYFYEFALRMSLLGGILTYGLTFVWFLINWFFIRPRQIRKQKEKISVVIDSLETIEKGFNS